MSAQLEDGQQPPAGVGFIGAGNVLWAYLQVLDRLVPRGLAWEGPIFGRDREAWPAISSRRPEARLVASAEEVWSSAVDVVVVITPPDTHAAYARDALEHGKHVVCEKPVGMHRGEAEAVFELAAASGLHVLAAPFVHLSPTFRELWTRVNRGEIGSVHSARAMYGNAGATWASWYHEAGVGPLAELGVYNLKSLTSLLGPVREVFAADAVAVSVREAGGRRIDSPDPDVVHVVLRHELGALSSVMASQAVQRYRRPGLELYGTQGTANLLGDDWDPQGLELWRTADVAWRTFDPLDATWLWTDGLREVVDALREARAPMVEPAQDLHVLDVIDAARTSARTGAPVPVDSTFPPLDLTIELDRSRSYAHDHTRPVDEQ
ncbi:MAG TPA: Gfo/Idh/MocA family oxidoreductase [Actinomycetota bacterium]